MSIKRRLNIQPTNLARIQIQFFYTFRDIPNRICKTASNFGKEILKIVLVQSTFYKMCRTWLFLRCCFSVTLCRQRRRNEHRIITHAYTAIVDLLRYRDTSSNVLQFSTFQRPLNKYLYKPFESFHPSSNKKAIIKGDFMRYVRNSSSFNSFYETREKFWKRLRVRGYPFRVS